TPRDFANWSDSIPDRAISSWSIIPISLCYLVGVLGIGWFIVAWYGSRLVFGLGWIRATFSFALFLAFVLGPAILLPLAVDVRP
ncbi:MAG: hypothetical protein AAF493_28205, partial [Pseudomonadota bacterium]